MATSFKQFVNERQIGLLERKIQLREEITEQVESNSGIFNNDYRLGSEAFFAFMEEARVMYRNGDLEVDDGDRDILESDIGEWAEYEGQYVPLDLPMAVFEDSREYDLSGSEEDRRFLFHKVIKPAYSHAKRNAENAEDEGHHQDMNALNELTDIYRAMGDVIKRRDNYAKLIRMYQNMSPENKTDFETYLKQTRGEVADKVRNQFLGTSTSVQEKASPKKKKSEKKDVALNKPKRGGPKKYFVYVKTDKGNVKKVTFGDSGNLKSKINDPEARKNFASRHNCSEKKDKTKAGYWSCNLPRYAKQLGLSGGGSFFW